MSQAYAGTAAVVARLADSGFSPSASELSLLSDLCDQANDYIEQYAWRPLGPTTGGTATFDAAEDVDWDGVLRVRQGIRSVTSATVAPSTGATAVSVTVGDLVILPRTQNRKPGWPGTELRFIDSVSGAVSSFGSGYGNIVIVGDFGWESIPASVIEVAETTVVRAWHARQSGQTDIVGSDANGEPIVSRYLSGRDKALLRSFRPGGGLVG